MNAAQRAEEIRKGILFDLHRIGRFGRPRARIQQLLTASVIECTEDEVQQALEYLEGKDYVAHRRASDLSHGLPDIWFITSPGMDLVERNFQGS